MKTSDAGPAVRFSVWVAVALVGLIASAAVHASVVSLAGDWVLDKSRGQIPEGARQSDHFLSIAVSERTLTRRVG